MMMREYRAPSRLPAGFRDVRLPDLFRDMRRAQEDINRLFGGFRFALRTEFPAANVWASADGAIVTAQVPGVKPDDLDVTVHQDTVTLRGRREPEVTDEGAVMHRRERPYGPFTRTFILPFRADADRVSARFDRGVLTLELPRPESDKPRHVKIVHG
jgi:HSP20 family protein